MRGEEVSVSKLYVHSSDGMDESLVYSSGFFFLLLLLVKRERYGRTDAMRDDDDDEEAKHVPWYLTKLE